MMMPTTNKNPSEEGKTEVGETPPELTFQLIYRNRRKILEILKDRKKLSALLRDETWGPHIHLFILLTIVLILAIILGIIQLLSS